MTTNRRTLALYWAQIRKHKTSFFLALICIPVTFLLLDALLPYFFSLAIDSLTTNEQAAAWQNLAIAAVIGLTGVIFNLIGFRSLAVHEANVRVELGNDTFSRLIHKDMLFFMNEKVGALTSRYIDFIRSHVAIQDLLIIRTLGFVISLITGLILLLLQSWLLALIIALLIIGLLMQVRWSLRKRAPWRHARKKLAGEIHGNVADAVTNNLIVKTFAGEEHEKTTISEQNKTFKDYFIRDIGFVAIEGSARLGVMTAVQIIAVGVSLHLVFTGQTSIGIVVFTLTYLQRLSMQIFALGDILNGYDQALLEAAPMSDILGKPTVVNDSPNATTMTGNRPDIEFRDVSYRYAADGEDVLHRVSLRIPAGQKVGLVGHSGAGKTTITHLLLRFSDVNEGRIGIGGHDIRDVTQESLRQNIAFVPQEPLLFHRSLHENIAYGKPDATDEEVVRAAKLAHAMEFIEKLPQGLETLVGERGVKLSGGQRQRIAIARAILKDAPILILDEATSALDSESERLIQASLGELMKNRTSIVIAHRLSTIQKMDRIIVLDNGKIIEDGTHHELLARGGTYASLWAHQSGGFIEE